MLESEEMGVEVEERLQFCHNRPLWELQRAARTVDRNVFVLPGGMQLLIS